MWVLYVKICNHHQQCDTSLLVPINRAISQRMRELVHTRLNKDSLTEGHTGINWSGVQRALTDWKTYVVAVAYSAMNLTLGSVSGFLPTIVKG